jgi:hypothetical protein
MTLKLLALTIVAQFVTSEATKAYAQPATGRCNVFVSAPWENGQTLIQAPIMRTEAYSDGPSCAKAVIVYVVRDSKGRIIYSQSHVSQFVAITRDARTPRQMRAALRDWVSLRNSALTSSSLPDWLPNADGPVPREFGFTPDPSISRATYLAIRASRSPILCYVQGIESLRCLVWRNNQLEPLGIQQFPS